MDINIEQMTDGLTYRGQDSISTLYFIFFSHPGDCIAFTKSFVSLKADETKAQKGSQRRWFQQSK